LSKKVDARFCGQDDLKIDLPKLTTLYKINCSKLLSLLKLAGNITAAQA
jgi:hypothetical protein